MYLLRSLNSEWYQISKNPLVHLSCTIWMTLISKLRFPVSIPSPNFKLFGTFLGHISQRTFIYQLHLAKSNPDFKFFILNSIPSSYSENKLLVPFSIFCTLYVPIKKKKTVLSHPCTPILTYMQNFKILASTDVFGRWWISQPVSHSVIINFGQSNS